jgi:hypothetical protein
MPKFTHNSYIFLKKGGKEEERRKRLSFVGVMT